MLSTEWRKATVSNSQGQCVQARWTRACMVPDQTCVEVMSGADGTIQVRDSKLGDASPVLSFTPAEWQAFLDGCSKGEFDLPAHLQVPVPA